MVRTSIKTEWVACDLCGSDSQTLLYSRLDPVTGGEYHVVECSCGMAFVNPMPVEQSIPDLYPHDYLKDKQDMQSLYERMRRLLPAIKGGWLLDIGCGRGDFIHHVKLNGWNVEGVDRLAWDARHGVAIRVGDFTELVFPEYKYDVITAWALLEHVRKPSSFFQKISGLLKDDGRFIFVVPNFGAPGMRHSCTEDVPRHLNLFTPKAVKSYLAKNGMQSEVILHNDNIYTSYPFGLLRYGFKRLLGKETRCSKYENRAVALLRNRQIKGNLQAWLGDVFREMRVIDIFVDTLDISVGVIVANWSKIIRNYGVMTVIARLNKQKKSNPF